MEYDEQADEQAEDRDVLPAIDPSLQDNVTINSSSTTLPKQPMATESRQAAVPTLSSVSADPQPSLPSVQDLPAVPAVSQPVQRTETETGTGEVGEVVIDQLEQATTITLTQNESHANSAASLQQSIGVSEAPTLPIKRKRQEVPLPNSASQLVPSASAIPAAQIISSKPSKKVKIGKGGTKVVGGVTP